MTASPAAALALVGPTAAGKSELALALARSTGGLEIVSIDSMQVYRGMDIGTAKPSATERAEVPHHLVDIVDPSEEMTVAGFQEAYRGVTSDVAFRGMAAVLVGGTGLYFRSCVDDLDIPGRYPVARAELEAEPDTEALYRRLTGLDPEAAGRMEPSNRRRVLRALEVTIGSGRRFSSFGPGLDSYAPVAFPIVGLRWPRARLDERIAGRLERQLEDGFLEEVEALAARLEGLSRTARQALGYRELLDHLEGRCSLAEAVEGAVIRTRRFARRQERWFRRDPRVEWLDVDDDPVPLVGALLERLERAQDGTG